MEALYSKNVFLDSSINTVGNDGRQARWITPAPQFSVGNRQYFKAGLTTFSMKRNWYNLNQHNAIWYAYHPTAVAPAPTWESIVLDFGDYSTFTDLATEIQNKLQALYGAGVTVTFNATSRKFTLDMSAAAGNWTADSFFVGFLVKEGANPDPSVITPNGFYGDAFEILGGFPTRDPSNVQNLFGSSVGLVQHVTPFVASLNSISEICIRTNLNGGNFQSYSYEKSLPDQSGLTTTDILARVPLNRTTYNETFEFIHFEDTNDLFSVIVPVKQINEIVLSVTDGKGRLLPQVQFPQAQVGQLSFRAVLKLTTLEDVKPSEHVFLPSDLKHPKTFSYS